MFKSVTPESVGISSELVKKYISRLEKRQIHMHSVLMARGNDLFCEAYWKPFSADKIHRMYSVTKSFVSVAIGLCAQDGLIDLDAPIASYFEDKIDTPLCKNLAEQTVRQMLTMTTTGFGVSWFSESDPDRTHFYFTDIGERHRAGTVWGYDSAGSQVMSSLVERVTGKRLFDYLNERIFTHLDAFKDAKILQTRNGDSWGDSAMICTSRDLLTFARFVKCLGEWNGKRLMNEDYLRLATTKQVCNITGAHYQATHHGYGYQFWITEQGAFAMVGMGDQLAICLPEKDFIFVCTADNQGNENAREYIIDNLFDIVVDNLEDSPLAENEDAVRELRDLCDSLELYAVKGEGDSPLRNEINGVTYKCDKSVSGLKSFRFDFKNENEGTLTYEKESGVMTLPFYVNKNRFVKFPELGYSNERGGVRTTDGFKYDSAVSLAWTDKNKIVIVAQIIDEYLGNAFMSFCFRGDGCTVSLDHTAEDFLWEYKGYINARRCL